VFCAALSDSGGRHCHSASPSAIRVECLKNPLLVAMIGTRISHPVTKICPGDVLAQPCHWRANRKTPLIQGLRTKKCPQTNRIVIYRMKVEVNRFQELKL